jgi:glycerol-3-phosphate dehydrogenase subunit B
MEADVIIIGGGMAGAVAALKVSEKGKTALLIRRGHGATAMSSGVIDVAGPTGFLPGDDWETLPPTGDRLKDILRTNPFHPYSTTKSDDRLQAALRDACAFAIEKVPSLDFMGSSERNMALPTVVGTVKFCAYAPASLASGDLTQMRQANMLLVGLEGLPYFRPRICKRSLSEYSSQHQPEAISKIEYIEMEMPGGTMRATPFGVAGLFDKPDVCEQFAQSLGQQIGDDVTHVGLPPILGLNRHAKAFEIIDRKVGPKLFELISPNYSVPGHRLQAALDKALRDSGVRVVTAGISEVECDGRLIKNLVLEGMKSGRTATADSYIVATGKFNSGGLVADDCPKEPLFGLPLFVDGSRVDDRLLEYLLEWDASIKQPFLSCGVHVDASLRPLDAFGEPAYDNLYAAGSIIGEYDYIAEGCGLGVAALTGCLAGERASA